MAERLPPQPLRGKKRRDVVVPPSMPTLDAEGLRAIQDWRSTVYKQPILDDLLGYYRFDPPTKRGADIYTGARGKIIGIEGMSREIVSRYVELPESVESAELRQVIHKAESTELATALFWSVAVMRSQVLNNALEAMGSGREIDEDVARFAADAIVDMGLCLESPYENNWRMRTHARQRKYPQGLGSKLETIAPGVGTNVADFGAYAGEHPEVLQTQDGFVAMHAAFIEQDYRMELWGPRHTAITEAFPDLPLSREILYMAVPLEEMLSIQDRLSEIA